MGAFNGSGVFVRSYDWTTDAGNGIKIRADRMDTEDDGFASGLSDCVTRDGQSPPSANLPMAGFRHTGVGNAVSRTDYLAAGQLQDGGPTFAVASGASGAYAITLAPAIAAYVDGMEVRVRFTSSNVGIVGVPTLAINGLSAIPLYAPLGQPFDQGAFAAGQEMTFRYVTASGHFVLVSDNGPVLLESGSSISAASLNIVRAFSGFRSFRLKLPSFSYASGASNILELIVKVGSSFLSSGYSGNVMYSDILAGTISWAPISVGSGAYLPLCQDNFSGGWSLFDIEIVPATTVKNFVAINVEGIAENVHGQALNKIWGANSTTSVLSGLTLLGAGSTFYKFDYEFWGIP